LFSCTIFTKLGTFQKLCSVATTIIPCNSILIHKQRQQTETSGWKSKTFLGPNKRAFVLFVSRGWIAICSLFVTEVIFIHYFLGLKGLNAWTMGDFSEEIWDVLLLRKRFNALTFRTFQFFTRKILFTKLLSPHSILYFLSF